MTCAFFSSGEKPPTIGNFHIVRSKSSFLFHGGKNKSSEMFCDNVVSEIVQPNSQGVGTLGFGGRHFKVASVVKYDFSDVLASYTKHGQFSAV